MPGANAGSVRGLADTLAEPRHPGRWGDLRMRTLSAVVLAPAVLACVWFGGLAWMALMGVAAIGLGVEWAALCLHRQGTRSTGRWPWLAAGVVYLGVPWLALFWLRGLEHGRADVIFLILVVWASDIGAYAVGRVVGGAKLAPAISPGKTWSGAIGGLGSAVLVGVLATWFLPGSVALAAGVAAVLGVAAQLGDLFESWLKRRFGVKDSGRVIPGHGGLLDRLDGLLAAATVAAVFAWLVGRGGALWN